MCGVEVVKALVSPVEKLIGGVSSAIGKAYEPRHIRKIAEAKAYEIEVVSKAVRDNSDIPIMYDKTKVSIDTRNYEEIAKRASSRLAYQEIKKQQNIENVVDNAYEELKNIEKVSNEPVNPDWMTRFFNSVEDISDEKMQKIWGRILSGEIKKPNSYSYRTLEKLKNMTQKEAEHFQLLASFALQWSNGSFILSDDELMNKYDIKFSYILELAECGLINDQVLTLNSKPANDQKLIINNSQIIGVIKGKGIDRKNFSIDIHAFTGSGYQLLKAIHPKENSNYIVDCLKLIKEKNQDFDISAYYINKIYDTGEIIYNTEKDLLISE